MSEPTFEVPNFYETALAMRYGTGDLGREFRFLGAPISAIPEENRHLLDDPIALLADVLELGESRPLRVAQLPDAIFTLLHLQIPSDTNQSVLELASDYEWLGARREADPDAALFAEYLAFAEVVPFEHSKPQVHSLATTAMKSYSAVGRLVGASPHTVVLGPHGPVVFISIAGVVAVVDSVGVIIGLAISDITLEVFHKVRHGFMKLLSRRGRRGPQTPPIAVDQITAEEQERRITTEMAAEAQRLFEAHAAETQRLRAQQDAQTQKLREEQDARVRTWQAELNKLAKGHKPIIVHPPEPDEQADKP